MTAALARALLTLAARCLGEDWRDWALAMRAELDVAEADGGALGFAWGCLLAASREMTLHREGRLTLACWGFALLLTIPAAAFVVSGVLMGLPFLTFAPAPGPGMVNAGNAAALPVLAATILAFGAVQLRLAWVVLERAWAQVAAIASLAAATATTLLAIAAVMFVYVALPLALAALVVTELLAAAALAHWHAEVEAARGRRRRGLGPAA